MKKALVVLLIVCLLGSNLLVVGLAAAEPAEKVPVIVGFKDRPDAELVRANGGSIRYEYSIIPAIACELPTRAIAALQNNPNIAYVERDVEYYALGGEVVPWGITRIGATTVHTSGNTGEGINLAVVDTGINYLHEDLAGNYKGGYNFISNNDNPWDDNGHGTHCAGIIAAIDNEIAVVGVAPKANLYAVKVLDSSGSGYLSTVVAGIDWATKTRSDSDPANDIQVISMSLGGGSSTTTLENACNAAYASGIVVVAASGNDGRSTVSYPAKYASVIAVGATDSNDKRPRWSNYGNELELMAPGVNILSTYIDVSPNDNRNVDTVTMSGTSMACPHVAGTAALVLASQIDPTYDTDGDGTWDAPEVRAKLQATADDLGTAGWDRYYGYGLVDADEAAAAPAQDITSPTISELTPANGATINTATTTISAKVSDPSGINTATIAMTLNGGTIIPVYDAGTGLVSYEVTSLADDAYTVSLAVEDTVGNKATTYWTFTVDTTAPPQPAINVDIDMSTSSRTVGKNTFITAIATITVTDVSVPVPGATVNGHWTGATTDSDTGTTNSDGKVALSSDSVKSTNIKTDFTFTVDTVVINGVTYEINKSNSTPP